MSDDQTDHFDEVARRAGAELRRPAPAGGLARVNAARRRRQYAGVAGVTAVAVVVGGLIVWAARDDDRTVAIDSTPSTAAVTSTSVTTPTRTESTLPPTTQATPTTSATTSTPTSTSTTSTVPPIAQLEGEASPGGSVSYLSPPPELELRSLGDIDWSGDESSWLDAAIGDLGIVVGQPANQGVTVVDFAGERRDVALDGQIGALVYGPGDVLYGLRGDTIEDFAMVAVPLSGERSGESVASHLLPIVQYTELTVDAFGHSSDGIIDRERAVNTMLMPYVDINGDRVQWTAPSPPLLTTTGDLDSPDVAISSDDGTVWQLRIDASPTRASPFIEEPRAAPGNGGLVVWVTHIGPNAEPDQDFGQPTMHVLAAMYPDGSVQWYSIPDGWEVVASDVWGTVLARRMDGRLELALAELPPPAVDFQTLIGHEWSRDTYVSDLGLPPNLRLVHGGMQESGGVHGFYDESSLTQQGMGGHRLLLTSDLLSEPGVTPTRWRVTGVLDLQLAPDEQLSLSHIGCWVDGIYDEAVFAVIAPPNVNGSPDASGRDWPARRAWRYVASGPPSEIDPAGVLCELAGE